MWQREKRKKIYTKKNGNFCAPNTLVSAHVAPEPEPNPFRPVLPPIPPSDVVLIYANQKAERDLNACACVCVCWLVDIILCFLNIFFFCQLSPSPCLSPPLPALCYANATPHAAWPPPHCVTLNAVDVVAGPRRRRRRRRQPGDFAGHKSEIVF